jgi:hypothetical protein
VSHAAEITSSAKVGLAVMLTGGPDLGSTVTKSPASSTDAAALEAGITIEPEGLTTSPEAL